MFKRWCGFLFLLILAACTQSPTLSPPISPASPTTAPLNPTVMIQTVIPTDGTMSNLQEITLSNAALVRWLQTFELPGYTRGAVSQCNTAFSPDSRLVLGVCGKGPVPVWEVQSGKLLYSLDTQNQQMVACTFSPDGKYLLCGGFDNAITLWDATNGQKLDILATFDSPVWDLAFSPDGTLLASCGITDSLRLWDFKDKKQLWQNEDSHDCLSLAFSPSGQQIAFGGRWGKAGLVNTEDGTLIAELIHAGNPVGDIAFSHNGKWLAAGTDDDQIYFWPADDLQSKQTWKGHNNYVNGVLFNRDDSLLISGSHDASLHLWDVAKGETIKILKEHVDIILRSSISPDGKVIASISWDGTVRLWGVPQE